MKRISKKNTEDISVKVVSINADGIFINAFGRDYFLSYHRLPWFKNAKVSDILNVTNIGTSAISWNKLDVDIEIDSLNYPEKYPLVMKRNINESLTE